MRSAEPGTLALHHRNPKVGHSDVQFVWQAFCQMFSGTAASDG